MDAPGLPAVGSFASASAPILLDRQHSSHDVALRRDPPEAESEWPGELEAVLAAVSSAATPTRAAGSSSSLTAADDSAFAATAGVSPSTGGAADGSPKIAARLGNGQPLELSHFVEVGTLASGGFSARVAVVELRGSNSAGSGTTGAASGSGGEQYALKTTDLRVLEDTGLSGSAPVGAIDAKRRRRALVECRALLDLGGHPLIPHLFAAFTSRAATRLHLLMELCPGTDLYTRLHAIPGCRMPEEQARFYVAEVLLALDHVHRHDLVYRDLKPENVVVNDLTGHIMLVDFDLTERASAVPGDDLPGGEEPDVRAADSFGVSPAEATPTTPKTGIPKPSPRRAICGTAEYVAPEVVAGAQHTAAADRWQAGILLFQLLLGDVPFRGRWPERTLYLIATAKLRFPDDARLSPAARALLAGMLRRNGGWEAPSDPRVRLGGKALAELQEHPFFDGLDWEWLPWAEPPLHRMPPAGSSASLASLSRGFED